MIVNMHDAKSQLSRLVEQANAGEEIVIARAGTPVARLVPYLEAPVRRQRGRLRGRLVVPDDFNDPDPNVIALFEGE